jgi:drug/metabolite transporter (DMT)-like permease
VAAGEAQLKTNINPLLLAIPASFDCIASTLMNIALTMVAASVYQMLRGMIIIITAGMSILFLKRKLYRHHWSSMGVIFLGVFMVGLAALLFPDEDKKDGETKALGLILLIVAQLFAGSLLIVEEKLLSNYYLDPLKVVGLEGLWGLLIWCVLLPIFQQIQCSSPDLCPYGRLEDTMRAFRDYDDKKVLITLSVCICLSIALFNGFGVSVTKNASAAQRSTIDTSRTVLIWIFFMAVPVYGKQLEHFKVLQLFGFILLVFGTLVFNEILILPFMGFDQFTRTALEKKKNGEEKGLLDGSREGADAPTYIGLSPQASYDATRNQRALERSKHANEDGGHLGYD